MIDHINNWLTQVKHNYGVNPLIFAAIYCAGIIPFWFSVYKIAAGLRRKNFKQVKIFAVVLAIVIIAPFTYVAVWGHNLPFGVWLIAVALIAYSTYSIFRKLKVTRR